MLNKKVKKEDLLGAWALLEYLNFPSLDVDFNTEREGCANPVQSLSDFVSTTYDNPLNVQRPSTVYFGVMEKSDLLSLFSTATRVPIKNQDLLSGKSWHVAFSLDPKGKYQEDSLILSPFFQLLLSGKSIHLTGDLEKSSKLQNDFLDSLTFLLEQGEWEQSKQVINKYFFEAGINVGVGECFISRPPSLENINLTGSFFVEDLVLAKSNTESENLVNAVLGDDSIKSEIDLGRDKSQGKRLLLNTPKFLSCWPSHPSHLLSRSQKISVNSILSEVNPGEVLGVNGPPGTGKSTLLFDAVSSIFVQRSISLAFSGRSTLFDKSDETEMTSSLIEGACDNSKMVVSSSNNSAVQNISLELPSLSKAKFSAGLDYFTETATVLYNKYSQNDVSTQYWGLISAPLGNKSNKDKFFAQICDQSEHRSLVSTLRRAQFSKLDYDFAVLRVASMLANYYLISCPAISKEFRQEDRDQLSITQELDNKYITIVKPLIERKSQIVASECRVLKTLPMPVSENERKQFEIAVQQIYAASDKKLLEIENEIHKEKASAIGGLAARIQLLSRLGLNRFPQILSQMNQQRDFDIDVMEQEHVAYGESSNLKSARASLFTACVDLQKQLILRDKDSFIPTLESLYLNYKRKAPLEKKQLDTIFFVCPVVSSSLASISNLFNKISTPYIDYSFIDEAGQAPAANSIGLLMRSKRAVAVGDPSQIKPVVTIPENVIADVFKFKGVPLEFSPLNFSAQALIDAKSKIFDSVSVNGKSVRVGVPLKVHRRCSLIPFSISNKIAYDGRMVFSGNESPTPLSIGQSSWFDVKSFSSIGNSNTEEIEQTFNLITKIITNQSDRQIIGQDKIFVISPFKKVADQLKEKANKLGLSEFVDVGTVHTFQGKESSVVFVVMGSKNGASGHRSRTWATQEPNLLNVAVTRAKSHVYFVGNSEDWSSSSSIAKTILDFVDHQSISTVIKKPFIKLVGS